MLAKEESTAAVGAGAAAVTGGGGPSVKRIPHRGHVSTTPPGTRDGSNRYGQLGFGHFNALDIPIAQDCGDHDLRTRLLSQ
jgi:hypothetical protein